MIALESRRSIPWAAFFATWVVVGLVLFVTKFQNGYLYNARPVLLAYVSVLLGEVSQRHLVLPWFALHLVIALALTAAGSLCRRRLSSASFTMTAAIVGGLFVGLVGWAGVRFWPDGIYFDSTNIEYDVSDLIQAAPGQTPRFESTRALAAYLEQRLAGRGQRYAPHHILGFSEERVFAWGTWPQHYHLRRELEAVRHE